MLAVTCPLFRSTEGKTMTIMSGSCRCSPPGAGGNAGAFQKEIAADAAERNQRNMLSAILISSKGGAFMANLIR